MRKAMLQPVLRVQGLTKDFTLGWFGQEWNIETANLFEKAFFSCIYIFFCVILSARNLNTLSVQHDIKTDQMINIFMTNLKDFLKELQVFLSTWQEFKNDFYMHAVSAF